MTRYIPNFITLLNAFSGSCAIVFLFKEQFELLFAAFAFCLISDFADGLVARILDVKSSLGKELDSMADMVSFGVLPGAIIFFLISSNNVNEFNELALGGFVFTCAAALRLARFNLDTRQSENFLGLAVPAATIFIVGLLWIKIQHSDHFLFDQYILLGITLLFSILMLTEIPMFSLKFKGFSFKENGIRYLFLIFAVGMLVFLKEFSISGIIVLYILTSVIFSIFKKKGN